MVALTGLLPAYPKLLGNLVPMWRNELHPEYIRFVEGKNKLDPAQVAPAKLVQEAQELVSAAAFYVCGLMFATMGASAGSEGLLTMAYDKLAKKEGTRKPPCSSWAGIISPSAPKNPLRPCPMDPPG